MLSGSLDPRRWLSFMLDEPMARRVLLSSEARSLAIGALVHPETQTVGALVSTYSFYESEDHRADVLHFLARLNDVRRDLGLAASRVVAAPELGEAVENLKANHDPAGALNLAMQRVVETRLGSVQGLYIEATDLDHLNVPQDLLGPNLTIAISAAHHRYPHAAWGTLTFLVVVLDGGSSKKMAGTLPPAF
jgi:hypothetical protein